MKGNDMMTSETGHTAIECFFCDETYHIQVALADLEAWENGMLIQEAMPYLTAGERELFISGTCDSCWEKMFPSD